MNPKKAADVLSSVPKELDMDAEMIHTLLDFYWTNVRKSISNVEYSSINITGLGVFDIMINRLLPTIDTYQQYLDKISTSKFSSYEKYDTVKRRLDSLIAVKNQITAETVRKKQHLENRYGKESYQNLERKGKDT